MPGACPAATSAQRSIRALGQSSTQAHSPRRNGHRELGALRAIGVDEIHIGHSHKFLTLVYQIEAFQPNSRPGDSVRLLWVGKDRTKLSFEKLFDLTGQQLAGKVGSVCSDMWPMWRPFLEGIAKHCPQALNILDRFHRVAKLDKSLDEIIVVNHAGEAGRMVREGYEPMLKNKHWSLLKRPENLTEKQRLSLRELLG